ncbi:hypothetical protein ACFWP3_41550 [Streptomyces sp. NPDC058525]|uniref:hypothetical protein n=1 Tax=Streptomyces sp. NPDC058525 TaxID=3346538 RepID=UPI0036477498
MRCFSQDGTEHQDFDFTRLSSPPALRDSLVAGFERRTRPGGGLASLRSVEHAYRTVVQFDRYMDTLAHRPRSMEQVAPGHFDGFYEHRRQIGTTAAWDLAALRLALLRADGLSEALAARLAGPMPKRHIYPGQNSYSRAEFKRIADAMRVVLRAAASRIRENREVLRRFREGELVPGRDRNLVRRLELLEHVDRFADVPRRVSTGGWKPGSLTPYPWVTVRGPVKEIVSWLHMTVDELAAAAVLLAVMTGENASVIFNTPAVHHRADGHSGAPATAIVDLVKPRRGRRAHMNLALSEVPDWISIPEDPAGISARDELHTAFGLYALLHELTARSREMAGGNRLLVGHFVKGGRGIGRGVRAMANEHWHFTELAKRFALMNDPEIGADGEPLPATPLVLRLDRLRMTYIELHQKPVAHTERTAAGTYLARNRGNITEYRTVVAETLDAEVAKARTRTVVSSMSRADIERARTDLEAVAAEQGVEPATLRRMLAGELDTVLAACTDNTNGPHTPPGEPCRASFMLCLGCECARALPRHLPLQVIVHDRLAARREEMDTLRWAQRFAGPHAQLADLLDQHDEAAVADARRQAGEADRALADRFLNRELDLR